MDVLTRKESRHTSRPYHSRRSNWKGTNRIALYLRRGRNCIHGRVNLLLFFAIPNVLLVQATPYTHAHVQFMWHAPALDRCKVATKLPPSQQVVALRSPTLIPKEPSRITVHSLLMGLQTRDTQLRGNSHSLPL